MNDNALICRPTLEQAGILLPVEERSEQIWQQACECAQQAGGSIPDSCRADLLAEVVNLVEAPKPLLGSFDSAFLSLPRCVQACSGNLTSCIASSFPDVMMTDGTFILG